MKIVRIIAAVLLALGAFTVYSQNTVTPVEEINKVDAEGLKQGKWERIYPNGKLMYKATFKDDKPVGEMIRYHSNGKMMARIVYDEAGVNGQGELYDENGRKVAEGRYIGNNKEGEWLFYNSKGVLISRENYKDNLKDGESYTYYENGKPALLTTWKDGVQQGPETQWYPSGATRVTTSFTNGKLHGPYTVYFENGNREIYGMYNMDKLDGTWFFFTALGQLDCKLTFANGVPKEQAILELRENERFSEFEKKRGRLKDPAHFKDDRDSYMMGRSSTEIFMTRESISLFELNNQIRQVISNNLPAQVWVRAEVAELREHANGHCYLDLVEKDEFSNQVIARLRATIWSYTYRTLKPFFENTAKRPLSNGIKVL